ncbi:TIGR03087 family PEP-CTERM/XrtA system glycosyltransferase [Tautonia rosea]|uniref:TIGR03087 family PEP-CTERM/XrtA system glycosyltransferase n=1 Tax=Tautonia rosea TaxID=2728037 RepID=UPI00147560E4|nr:TIGR03087 family PEP-CTERM/XrtA system glycosyltransferase [Tautonia rosea]
MTLHVESTPAVPETAQHAPALLYVTHRVPYPPDKGDRIRNYHLLRFLARHSRVHLATLADEPVTASTTKALEHLCHRVAIVPLGRWTRRAQIALSMLSGRTASEGAFASTQLRTVLRDWGRQTRFQAVLASASSVAPYLRLPEFRDVPAIVDLVDVDSQKWLDYAEAGRGVRAWLYRLEGDRVRRLERSLPRWARAVTLVSEAEAALYRRLQPEGDGAVLAVTNGVDLSYFQPSSEPSDPSRCVFVGALDYRPNIDGIRWFCREVWPSVLRRHPAARLALVGRNPGAEVVRLAEIPGVELIGSVPDVRPHLARSAVVVAPLLMARGVQNKVLEAMAMSKPVVASSQAIDGLAVEPGTHLLEAATPAQWTEHLSRLLSREDCRQSLGAAGRRYVEETHRWEHCLNAFSTLLDPSDVASRL